jgi:glutamate synthase (NADPH/NADH) small chain
MLWRMEDYWAAQEEGVLFVPLTELAALIGNRDGQVAKIVYQHMRVSGREQHSQPIAIEGAQDTIEIDLVILAPEPGPDLLLSRQVSGLEVDDQGWILVDQTTGQTSREGVFAAGDITGQSYLAAMAIAEGRRVAANIHEYLA